MSLRFTGLETKPWIAEDAGPEASRRRREEKRLRPPREGGRELGMPVGI